MAVVVSPCSANADLSHRGGFGLPPRGKGTLDEHLAVGRLEMLVQQPNAESLPCIGGDETLAEFGKAGAIVLSEDTDLGGIHVEQRRVVLNTVVPYHQHSLYLPNPKDV